ncbi:MAG: formylmethanofuran dehydrogenase subunit E family protein [Clostridia bacterium]|nr:formylmethanofuran dehydrogenase subunit E family protein [Clostridia bacterium]
MSFPTFDECVKFHGHLCGGVSMGYVLSRYAMDKLGAQPGDPLYCIAEFQNCLIDAIQCMTGCTTGKKNLVIKDEGSRAITLVNKDTGEGYHVTIDIKVPDGLSKSEASEYILAADPEAVCKAVPVKIDIPAKH